MEGNFDSIGTPVDVPEYVTIVGPDGATVLQTIKTLTREEFITAFGGSTTVPETAETFWGIPFIDRIDLPLEDKSVPWYEAAHQFGPYNLHPEYCLDWNWESGGDTDLGAGIAAPMNGIVMYAQDAKGTWGNIVQITGFMLVEGKVKIYTWMGAHCKTIDVQVGQIVSRGQHIATVGNANGQYAAHIHEQWAQGIPPATAYPSNKAYEWLHPINVYKTFMDEDTLQHFLVKDGV